MVWWFFLSHIDVIKIQKQLFKNKWRICFCFITENEKKMDYFRQQNISFAQMFTWFKTHSLWLKVYWSCIQPVSSRTSHHRETSMVRICFNTKQPCFLIQKENKYLFTSTDTRHYDYETIFMSDIQLKLHRH